MKRFYQGTGVAALLAALVFGIASSVAAQSINEREVRDTVRSLRSKIDDLDMTLNFQLRSNSASRTVRDDARSGIDALKNAVKTFDENVGLRRENRSDIEQIVAAGRDMAGFFTANPQNRRIESTWTDVRDLIDRLAANYGVRPDWNGRISNVSGRAGDDDYGYQPVGGPVSPGLTGTYRLDTSRSEKAADIVADINISGSNRTDLESKLDAPDSIALLVRGSEVTLATTNADPVTFVADGRERSENSGGRTVRLRASIRGDEITISSLGGETDYTIIFTSIDNGRGLKVTRRITTEYLSETIFADSYYTKSEQTAGLGIDPAVQRDIPTDTDASYSDNDAGYSTNDPDDRVGANSPNPTLSKPRIGQFIVPNGTVITGTLENEINTKASQNNDRFKMTVQGPMEFRGAVIEGYITGVGRSGQVSGRSNVTFNFERITLRDGRAYDFAGSLSGIRDERGKEVKVDTEGTAQGDSQTKETAKRGGIGAGIGAVIGAIAGGGKGAVLGAIIGGGAGAGSVIATGRDDVRLMPGSTITVVSSSPVRGNSDPQNN
ncbi:MAG TPA: hypothetical protein DEP46_11900 [Blastocatellia bacterium]|nr:hypothetical protein [Blastocatellia bacterium]